MKFFFVACFSFLLSQNILAQAEVVTFVNFEEAKEYAAENDQNILMVLAGSDWCKPCIQFKKDILQSTAFSDRLSDKLVVLYLDFPAKRKNRLSKEQTMHNEALAERFNKSGAFPKLVLVDTKEAVVSNLKFKGQAALDFVHEVQTVLE